jgi:methylthioribose-1-phosphate isomerase
MTDKRPIELASYIEAATEKNDALILEALGKIENLKTRGKFKATVSSVCEITSLSRNTIRNRKWALDRLRDIKNKIKNEFVVSQDFGSEKEDDAAILNKLRERIKLILEQNSLLYEEILCLHKIVGKKDAEIRELKVRKLERI